MRFREVEKIILADGWQYKNAKGSHCQYIYPLKTDTAHHKGEPFYEINLSCLFLSLWLQMPPPAGFLMNWKTGNPPQKQVHWKALLQNPAVL